MNIYIGNLSSDVTEDELRDMFSGFGELVSVKLITDKFSGESRGFAFVEMSSDTDAQNAIAELNGKEMHGKAIVVNPARPKESSGGRPGGGGGGGGGFGGRRGHGGHGGGGGGGGYGNRGGGRGDFRGGRGGDGGGRRTGPRGNR